MYFYFIEVIIVVNILIYIIIWLMFDFFIGLLSVIKDKDEVIFFLFLVIIIFLKFGIIFSFVSRYLIFFF